MLVLKHLKVKEHSALPGEIYNLSVRPEHVVGRLGTLVLLDDPSVSRHHACIKVSVKNSKLQVTLEDLGSKYGTYVNEGIERSKEIPKKCAIPLKVGDNIRFGQQWNSWKLMEEPFVICTSTLTAQEKSFMSKIAMKLNGILVSEWTKNCTHLTMNQIKITVKVVCALGHVKPVVTVDYWKQLVAILASKKETPVPDYVNFIPDLAEPLLIANHFDFKMKNERRNLFKDVKFLAFGSTQLNAVLPMVEAAGGTVFDGKIFKINEEQLLNEKIIVIQPKDEEMATAKDYLRILSAHRLRAIPESEICLSVANCSLDRYCNPAYDVSVLFKQPGTQVTIKDNATILAIGTQDIEEDTEYQEDPGGSNFSLTVNDKNQVFSESDDDIGDSDRSVIEDSANVVTSGRSTRASAKRKLEEIDDKPTKNSKLDAWIVGQKQANTNANDNSESLLSGPSASKKPTKDLFSFGIEKKRTTKNSSSLFGGLGGEQINQTSGDSLAKKNSSEQSTSSFLFSSQRRATEESSARIVNNEKQPTKRSTRSLFAGLNATEKESPALFSSDSGSRTESKKVTEDRSETCNKRKLVDSFGPSTSKKPNRSTKSLFELPSNKKVKPKEIIDVMDSEEETDGFLERETDSKLNISTDTRTAPPMPVVEVPTMVSLSQFVDVPVENPNIKTEPLDLPTQIQEVLNKTVVLTVPLTKNPRKDVSKVEENSSSKANFKKFRKKNEKVRSDPALSPKPSISSSAHSLSPSSPNSI